MEPEDKNRATASGRVRGALVKNPGHPRDPVDATATAWWRKLPCRVRYHVSAAEPRQLIDFGNQLVQKAFESGLFIYADTDLKFDQPQTEVVFDRDKLRSQGVDLTQAGQDLATMMGGDYVNRFSIQGRSYKVIPQIKRADRLTPGQLEQIYVTGSDNKLVPLSTFATLKNTTEPRELKKFQQLNAVTIQGVIPPNVPLDKALGFLEDQAK